MLAKLNSIALSGVEALIVEVELDLCGGLVGMRIVGLPDNAVRESADRVKAALRNCNYQYPQRKMVVNLAPAELKKEGAVYDLPIALSILIASNQLEPKRCLNYLIMGELSLEGALRPVRGVLAAAITAKQNNLEGIIIPAENYAEAAVLKDEINVVAVKNLTEAVGFLSGELEIKPPLATAEESEYLPPLCFSDVRGQDHVKRALEISAAGGHNILMMGPPGSGKTMSAKRLPSILPELTFEESLEVTKLHSIAGELPPGKGLIKRRPFRTPHHSSSPAGLVGGGSSAKPGELSLAHNGVLFLDEAPEFSRNLLETLRQPLEDGEITISRVSQTNKYPANIMLVLSMNMCPCGKLGDKRKVCRCSPKQIERYAARLSGPLLDRIDLHIEAPSVSYDELRAPKAEETSEQIRQRVVNARVIQQKRYHNSSTPVNARMSHQEMEDICSLPPEAESLLKMAVDDLGLSARACSRVLKVARTIADLAGEDNINIEHLSEAIQYRVLDKRSSY